MSNLFFNFKRKFFSVSTSLKLSKQKENLENLRNSMKKEGYDGYMLINSDPHKNEYLAEEDKKIKYISNFSGSNAFALVTLNEAILWTDSRYYIQADKELDKSDWKMLPIENIESDLKDYISKNLEEGKKIGIDLKNFSVKYFTFLKNSLKNHKIINDNKDILKNLEILSEAPENLVLAKKSDRIFVHELKYSGKTPLKKFKDVKRNLNELIISNSKCTKEKAILSTAKSFAIVLNKLDDIAWLTNLRGSDIDFNPVFFSYAILYVNENDGDEYLNLYVDDNKLKDVENIYDHLNSNKIKISPYQRIYEDLKAISDDHMIILDKNSCNQFIYEQIISSNKKHFLSGINIVEWTKAIKNETELEGFRECHKRDGAAIVRYLAWLEDQIVNRKNSITEYEGARKLLNFRQENDLFIDESFDTISSSGDNSAIIHYKPSPENCKQISTNEIYLLDSGGHYLDGTTDTTRTFQFGTPSEKEKEMYTRVLLGNLSVEKIFLNKNKKLSGSHIDNLARQYLWRIAEDFGHGTGHGVGHFLNVHEGPHGISPRSTIPLQANMIVTNEPGYYLKDHFGIRIENILLIRQHINMKDFLYFENVTQVFYDTNLIDKSLLSKEMIDHINTYHDSIYRTLQKNLKIFKDEFDSLEYLKRKTKYI